MPETKLTDRVLNFLGFEKKSAEDRPSFGQLSSYNWNQPSFFSRFGYGIHHNRLNYRHEVGNLEDSSLVMAVCNDTGITLAEAEPAVRIPDKNGEMQPVPGHELATLIANPNPYHIWEDYCLAGAFSYWSDGNWYFKIVRDLTGKPIELWYLPHFMVYPRWLGDGKSPEVPAVSEDGIPSDPFLSHYQYDIPGRVPVLIPAKDMLHIKRGVNLQNPRLGVGAFDPLIVDIYGDKNRAHFSATVLKNMGIVVPLLAPTDKDVTVTPEQAAHIKEQWMLGTTGENVGKPMINPIALTVEKFAFSPQELDLKELADVPESRIAAVTRYPASYLQFLVGLKNGTSYASYKEAREQAYESVIVPIQNGIARRITQKLLPEFDKTKGAHFIFDTSNVRVLQEDQDNLFKRAGVGYLAGWLMRSEARKMAKLKVSPEDEIFFEPRGSGVIKEGEDPTAASTALPGKTPAKGFESVAEIEQYLGYLESEMKDFVVKK